MYPHMEPKRAVGIVFAAFALMLVGIAVVVGSLASDNRALSAEVASLDARNTALTEDVRVARALCAGYAESEQTLTAALTAANEDAADNAARYSREKAAHAKHHQGAPRAASRQQPTTGSVTRWEPLVRRYFGSNTPAALRVMAGESGGDPNARNGSCVGLYQIHSKAHADKVREKAREWRMTADLTDAEFNIRFAAYMSGGGRNWTSWEVQP